MKVTIKNVFILALFSFAHLPITNAALIDRGNGLIYDTELNITWLQDANYSFTSGYDDDGRMTWSDAMAWVSQLTYAGFTGWRLPTVSQPDPTCSQQDIVPDGSLSHGFGCTGSEMGRLFYNTLNQEVIDSPFINIFYTDSTFYWSSTDSPITTSMAFQFYFLNGDQRTDGKTDGGHAAWAVHDGGHAAWAVHDGDIGMSSVPVPAAAWLFGSGLIGLIGIARRRF